MGWSFPTDHVFPLTSLPHARPEQTLLRDTALGIRGGGCDDVLVSWFIHLSSSPGCQLHRGWDLADVACAASPSPSTELGPTEQVLSERTADAGSWGKGLPGAGDDAAIRGLGQAWGLVGLGSNPTPAVTLGNLG